MSLKERIENNIFRILVGAVIGTAGVVTGANQWFSSKQTELLKSNHQAEVNQLQNETKLLESNHQAEVSRLQDEHIAKIDEIEAQLASIKRRMGEQEYLDVRTFVLTKDQALEELSASSRFFSEDGFYSSVDEAHWAYTKTTELDLIQLITEQSLGSLSELATLIPLHLWRGKDTLSVEGNSIYKSLFPFVSLQRLPYEQFKQVFGEAESATLAEDISGTSGEDPQEFLTEMERIFRGDAVGTFFTIYLDQRFILPISYPDIGIELLEVQKLGNVLYAQSLVTLEDVTVAQTDHSRYFIWQELIMVSTPTDLYMINTFIPSQEPIPRGAYFQWINAWFGDLGIIID